VALVNDDVNPALPRALGAIGFRVRYSHAFDCDAVVAWTVRLHRYADRIIICSGDHGYLPLVHLLKTIQRGVVVCALNRSCSRLLRSVSDQYVEIPSYVPEVRHSLRKGSHAPWPEETKSTA